jgi:hypothetical protein
VNATADRIHCLPAETLPTADRMHATRHGMRAIAGRMNCPQSEIHPMRDRIHAIAGRVNAIAGHVNAIGGGMQAARRRTDATREHRNVPRASASPVPEAASAAQATLRMIGERVRECAAGLTGAVSCAAIRSPMRSFVMKIVRSIAAAALAAALALPLAAQTAPAATPAAPPPDDNPSYKIGVLLFTDYTYNASPETRDADNNLVHTSSFNVSRAYINVTGQLNHLIAFRITPDIVRETGSGSSLSGSQTFRLKYAFAQLNLDDWLTKGSWVRLGVQQTPIIDYTEQIYRYRFQGPIFVDRTGILIASDNGLSGHYNFSGNRGDVHAGFYNGEGYARTEANDEKAFQIRASWRPLPLSGIWKGLRVTGFFDDDHVARNAKRQRMLEQVTFEHAVVNAGFELVQVKDQPSATRASVDGRGWSAWVTPRFGKSGFEALLRHDDLEPNENLSSQTQKRDIVGVAYWLPNLNKVTAAVMVDYDRLHQSGFTPSRANDTRYGVKLMVSF